MNSMRPSGRIRTRISTGVCIAGSNVSDVPFVGTSTRIRRNRSLVSNAQEDLLIPTSRRKNSTRFLPRLFVPFLPDRVAHSDNQKEDFLALASTRKPDRYERLPNTWTRRVPRTFHVLFSFSPSIRVCPLDAPEKPVYTYIACTLFNMPGCRIVRYFPFFFQ